MANEIIAYDKCLRCGARVAVKVDKRGLLYHYCGGADDPDRRACAARHFDGRTTSENLMRDYAVAKIEADHAGPKSEPEPARPERPAEPEPEGGSVEPGAEPEPGAGKGRGASVYDEL